MALCRHRRVDHFAADSPSGRLVVTGRELLDRAKITEVWTGLGGGPLRHNRGSAWWRNSTSRSVSLLPDKNCWCDHKAGEGGGGVLALIQHALACDKAAALEWLADFHGVSLDNRPLSIDQRRVWRRKRSSAKARGAELIQWREALLREIRQRRDRIWEGVLAAERFGRQFVNEPGRDDLWDFCFACLAEEPEGERLDRWVGRIEAMGPVELVALRQSMATRGDKAA